MTEAQPTSYPTSSPSPQAQDEYFETTTHKGARILNHANPQNQSSKDFVYRTHKGSKVVSATPLPLQPWEQGRAAFKEFQASPELVEKESLQKRIQAEITHFNNTIKQLTADIRTPGITDNEAAALQRAINNLNAQREARQNILTDVKAGYSEQSAREKASYELERRAATLIRKREATKREAEQKAITIQLPVGERARYTETELARLYEMGRAEKLGAAPDYNPVFITTPMPEPLPEPEKPEAPLGGESMISAGPVYFPPPTLKEKITKAYVESSVFTMVTAPRKATEKVIEYAERIPRIFAGIDIAEEKREFKLEEPKLKYKEGERMSNLIIGSGEPTISAERPIIIKTAEPSLPGATREFVKEELPAAAKRRIALSKIQGEAEQDSARYGTYLQEQVNKEKLSVEEANKLYQTYAEKKSIEVQKKIQPIEAEYLRKEALYTAPSMFVASALITGTASLFPGGIAALGVAGITQAAFKRKEIAAAYAYAPGAMLISGGASLVGGILGAGLVGGIKYGVKRIQISKAIQRARVVPKFKFISTEKEVAALKINPGQKADIRIALKQGATIRKITTRLEAGSSKDVAALPSVRGEFIEIVSREGVVLERILIGYTTAKIGGKVISKEVYSEAVGKLKGDEAIMFGRTAIGKTQYVMKPTGIGKADIVPMFKQGRIYTTLEKGKLTGYERLPGGYERILTQAELRLLGKAKLRGDVSDFRLIGIAEKYAIKRGKEPYLLDWDIAKPYLKGEAVLLRRQFGMDYLVKPLYKGRVVPGEETLLLTGTKMFAGRGEGFMQLVKPIIKKVPEVKPWKILKEVKVKPPKIDYTAPTILKDSLKIMGKIPEPTRMQLFGLIEQQKAGVPSLVTYEAGFSAAISGAGAKALRTTGMGIAGFSLALDTTKISPFAIERVKVKPREKDIVTARDRTAELIAPISVTRVKPRVTERKAVSPNLSSIFRTEVIEVTKVKPDVILGISPIEKQKLKLKQKQIVKGRHAYPQPLVGGGETMFPFGFKPAPPGVLFPFVRLPKFAKVDQPTGRGLKKPKRYTPTLGGAISGRYIKREPSRNVLYSGFEERLPARKPARRKEPKKKKKKKKDLSFGQFFRL